MLADYRSGALTACIALFALTWPSPARAADWARDARGGWTVQGDLPRKIDQLQTYDARPVPHGIPVGAFLLLPSVTALVIYDDHVFAGSRHRQDDFVFRVEPEVRLVSQWSRHHLELIAGGRGDFHRDFTSENHGQFHAAGKAVVDVRHDLKILSHFKYSAGHEARGAGEALPAFDDLVRYQAIDGALFVNKSFNRLWVELGGAVRQADYRDASIAGVVFDQDFRDGTIHEVAGRVGYEVSAGTSLFAEVAHNRRDYRHADFDSEGYRVGGGLSYEFTRLVRGEVAAGYLSQDLEAAPRKDISTYSYRGQLVWEPTQLTRVALVGRRDLGAPSNLAGASSRIDSEAGVRVDHAVRQDVMLSALAAYRWVDFVDAGGQDHAVTLQGTAQYFLSPTLSLWLEHTYTDYDSGAPDVSDYVRNRVGAGVKARF
jgi:hypothetical protein